LRVRDIPAPQAPEERDRARRRSRVVQAAVTLLFTILLGRLWYLQIARGEALRRASEMNRLRRERQMAPRGEIRDRAGRLLAGTRPKFVLSVDPLQFKPIRPEGRLLAECLNMPYEELKSRCKPVGPKYQRVRVAIDIPWDALARIEEHKAWLPGVSVDLEELRYYPQAKLGAHLLGYIGPISERELQENPEVYAPSSRVGMTGLERSYEKDLRGCDGGLILEVDATGRRTRLLRKDAPQRGADLVLTIDSAVQEAAERGLAGKVGSAVAIDPSNGEVLALASRPAYDPNLFAQGIGVKAWRSILHDKNLPLMNRAIQSAYPPGSTFKLISALAGLKAGKTTPGSSAYCTGATFLGKRRFRCWKRHGYVTFYTALSESCDIFFYNLGRSVGVQAISDMAKAFGLGSPTGIDLINERSGTVPSVEWKRRYVKPDPVWHPGETYNLSIGQGYLETSTLQMASVTGAVAAHGRVYRPHLVRAVIHNGKQTLAPPKLSRTVNLPAQYFDHVIRGLELTVTSGTGRAAALPGIRIGGKTGSAETTGAAHAWFVSVAPLDDPKIAVAVMVEHGAHGATAAAPIARDMMAAYFKVRSTPAPTVSGD